MVGIAQGIRIGGADEAAALELGVEHQRDDQAEDGLERDRDDREAHRVPDRVPPVAIGQNAVPIPPSL